MPRLLGGRITLAPIRRTEQIILAWNLIMI
jgi:hypothetical protein